MSRLERHPTVLAARERILDDAVEMANRCYMVGWDTTKGVPMKPSLELNYDVPLFWYGMFDVDDIHDVTVDGDAFVKPPGAAPEFEIQTYLFCAAAKAIERLAQRTPLLTAATKKDVLAAKFKKFIGGFAERSFLLQVSELAWMQPAGQYVQHLRAQVALVADPTTPPTKLVSPAGLEQLETSEYAENLLIGWGSELTAREKDRAKQRKEATRAANAEVKRNEQWQAAINACPPDGRKPYRASGTYQAGDVIEHVKFGAGVVLRVVDKKKLEVQFADAAHVLVHQPA